MVYDRLSRHESAKISAKEKGNDADIIFAGHGMTLSGRVIAASSHLKQGLMRFLMRLMTRDADDAGA